MEVLENLQFEGEIFFKLQEAEREAQLTGQRYSSQDVLQAMKITKKRRKAPAFRYGDIRRIQISE